MEEKKYLISEEELKDLQQYYGGDNMNNWLKKIKSKPEAKTLNRAEVEKIIMILKNDIEHACTIRFMIDFDKTFEDTIDAICNLVVYQECALIARGRIEKSDICTFFIQDGARKDFYNVLQNCFQTKIREGKIVDKDIEIIVKKGRNNDTKR